MLFQSSTSMAWISLRKHCPQTVTSKQEGFHRFQPKAFFSCDSHPWESSSSKDRKKKKYWSWLWGWKLIILEETEFSAWKSQSDEVGTDCSNLYPAWLWTFQGSRGTPGSWENPNPCPTPLPEQTLPRRSCLCQFCRSRVTLPRMQSWFGTERTKIGRNVWKVPW